MNQKSIFIGAVAALIVLFVGATMVFNASKSAAPVSEAVLTALDRAHAASLGEPDAPVVITEFLDPACETCAMFYPAVKDMMAAEPGRIRLVLRWAPFHAGSPEVVALLEAARRQDRFWPALERLLATQNAWAINHRADVNLAWQQLGGVGLDVEQLRADMASADVRQIIQQDLADAEWLGVTMTPEYFVNGRPLPSFGWEQLAQLVNEELAGIR